MRIHNIALILLVGCGGYFAAARLSGARPQTSTEVARAYFKVSGDVALPVGYRAWNHVGTRYKPVGVSILDGEVTQTPEMLNAYVEPGALAVFEKTGRWPDGTQFVKEFSSIKIGEGCDRQTFICTTPFGEGIFETGYIGLGMMVKDAARFPRDPGNWGYFSFGHRAPPYESTSPLRAHSQCAACHVKLASDTDYVIVKAHIGLIGVSPR